MKLYKICFDQDGTNHGTRVELAANVMSKIIFLSHWPSPLLLLAALCVLQVGVIDNKRLFVVQSRGELREGGDRQVFKEKYDNNYDDNIVWPLIMVPVKMMMMIWWHKYTGTWDHAVRGSTDHAEGEVSWKFDRHRFFLLPLNSTSLQFQIWRPAWHRDLFWDPRVPEEAKRGAWWPKVGRKYFEVNLSAADREGLASEGQC